MDIQIYNPGGFNGSDADVFMITCMMELMKTENHPSTASPSSSLELEMENWK